MRTADIYNYRKVDEDTFTAGQPSADQLRAAAAEGVTTVINLLPAHERRALPDEAALVEALGMDYHYIPVDWLHPTEQDFAAFEAAMQRRRAGKTLIHCAANYRVTAFYALYALKHLRWTPEQAETFRASIWQGSDVPQWESFIAALRAKIAP
ncbi:MAG: protein tyrosine phosphatase family protein [Chloroflexi bacterium]|nr:protein tyrosine phosphatase family protein [Chloroflexota bacterium]